MNTRIRYRKTGDPGIIASIKKYTHPTNGATYQVLINEPEKAYRIVETTSNTVVGGGRAVNLHQVKIKAKKNLEKLEISFDDKEKRQVKVKAEEV